MRRLATIPLLCWLLAAATLPALALPDEKDKWIEIRTSNFTLLSNAGKRQAMKMGKKLEQLREVLAETSKGMTLHSPLPTTIYIFKNRSSFAPYNIGEDGRPDETAGFFFRSIDGNYVAVDASAESLPYGVIYHEYLHYFIENNVPAVPLWLNEGLGEFYSSFKVVGGEARIGVSLPSHLWWLSQHSLMRLDRLFSIDTASEDYNEGERQNTFYAQSWALTHYLLVEPSKRDRMGSLLRLLSQGVDSAEAFEKVYETDVATLQRELWAYIHADAHGYYTYTPEEAFDEQDAEARRMERKEVLFHLGDLLVHSPPVQVEDAERHLRAALALDPSYAEAYVALAALRIQEERFEEADELCRKAIGLDASNPRAYALYGTSLLDRFDASVDENALIVDTTPPLVLEARKQFRTALELSEDDVDSLIGLGTTYMYGRGEVGEGVDALARAYRVRPARTELLVELIILTARSGNVAGAKSLLERGLRPRGNADLTRAAEAGLVEIVLREVETLMRQGEIAEGIERIRTVAEDVQDPEIKQFLLAEAERLSYASGIEGLVDLRTQAIEAQMAGDAEKADELIEQFTETAEASDKSYEVFNEALRLAKAGEFEQAALLFEKVAGSPTHVELRNAAKNGAEEARRLLNHNRQVARYNEAVDLGNAGNLQGAAAILRELLQDAPAEDLKPQAERLLRKFEQASVE